MDSNIVSNYIFSKVLEKQRSSMHCRRPHSPTRSLNRAPTAFCPTVAATTRNRAWHPKVIDGPGKFRDCYLAKAISPQLVTFLSLNYVLKMLGQHSLRNGGGRGLSRPEAQKPTQSHVRQLAQFRNRPTSNAQFEQLNQLIDLCNWIIKLIVCVT